MSLPAISPYLAATLCGDEYTGMPAMDDPIWQGANERCRSTTHEEWAYCYDRSTGKISAQNEDGEGAMAIIGLEGWDAL